MNGIYKRMAVAVLTMLALALAASPASAEEFFFQSEAKETTLKGVQDSTQVLTTTAGTVECKKASYTGTMVETELKTIELAPTFSECTSGEKTATFEMNGCKYRFNNGSIESEQNKGTFSLVCPEGKEVAVTIKVFGLPFCTIHLAGQSSLATVTYTNLNGNEESKITADVNVKEKLKYTHSGSGCTSGSSSTGSLAVKATVEGESGGKQVGVAGDRNITAEISVTPALLPFGGMGKGATTQITIKNTGNLRFWLGKETIDPATADFKISASTCGIPTSFRKGESCITTIEWVTGFKTTLKQYVIQFGTFWNDKAHERKVDITSG
jgi:hypothetical protein